MACLLACISAILLPSCSSPAPLVDGILSDGRPVAGNGSAAAVGEIIGDMEGDGAPVGGNVRRPDMSSLLTAGEVREDLAGRGFGELDIYSDFTADGTYIGYTRLDTSLPAVYPVYYAEYRTGGSIWNLCIVESSVYACPKALDRRIVEADVVLSEDGRFVCYSGSSNAYSDFDSGTLGVVGIEVGSIDAETLDGFGWSDILGSI